ncbi:hypothetical protein A3732_15265 [Oleiphilus sp. HI0050]|nr:hypothetical protein A3732_15265 [Oleiphilus sp. HI0050]
MNKYICLGLLTHSLLSLPVLAQECSSDTIAETTPATQFVIHGDGTITDTSTALMWKQCLEGLSGTQCNPAFSTSRTGQELFRSLVI